MNAHQDTCRHCGRPIVAGAMRCPQCGKIQKTPEEQLAALERLRAGQKNKPFPWGGLVRFVLYALALFLVYYFLGGEIIGFLRWVFSGG